MDRDAAVPVFSIEGVRQQRGARTILEGIELRIPAGGFTALIGPSGAGKSSLLRLLNRLDDPVAGLVRYRGERIDALPVRVLRRRVAFVFQTPAMFAGTVAHNLAVARDLGLPGGTRRGAGATSDDFAETLTLVELDPSYATRDATTLSGGEKQRVALARALMTGPDVLLLDEPTAALDPEVADHLMATLARLMRQGLSIVMVTHRLREARTAATHVVMLEAGRVVEAGPAAQLLHDAVNARTREFVAADE